jgi:uncharacterized membrane protein
MPRIIYCTPDGEAKAEQVINQLKDAGFSSKDISVILPDPTGNMFLAYEFNHKSKEGTATGATTGAVAGGILGWLAGVGTLALPGIGPLVMAGPIMAAMAGVAAGGAVGGLSGALIGLGLKEDDVNRYVGRIKEGRVMISVHTDDPEQEEKARAIFDAAGVEEGSCVEGAPNEIRSDAEKAA